MKTDRDLAKIVNVDLSDVDAVIKRLEEINSESKLTSSEISKFEKSLPKSYEKEDVFWLYLRRKGMILLRQEEFVKRNIQEELPRNGYLLVEITAEGFVKRKKYNGEKIGANQTILSKDDRNTEVELENIKNKIKSIKNIRILPYITYEEFKEYTKDDDKKNKEFMEKVYRIRPDFEQKLSKEMNEKIDKKGSSKSKAKSTKIKPFTKKMRELVNEMYEKNTSIIGYVIENKGSFKENMTRFKSVVNKLGDIQKLLKEKTIEELFENEEIEFIQKAIEVVQEDKKIKAMNVEFAMIIAEGTMTLEDFVKLKDLEKLKNRLRTEAKKIKESKDNADEEGEMEARVEYSSLTKEIRKYSEFERNTFQEIWKKRKYSKLERITFQEIWNTCKYQEIEFPKEKLMEQLYREILTTKDENNLLTNLFSSDGNQKKAQENLYSFLKHLYTVKLSETDDQIRIKVKAQEKLRSGFLEDVVNERKYDGSKPYKGQTPTGKIVLVYPKDKPKLPDER